jgi:hypothetical protein
MRIQDAAQVVDVGHGVDNARPDSRALMMGWRRSRLAYACAPGMKVEAHATRRCSGGISLCWSRQGRGSADAHLGMQVTDPEEVEVEVETETELDSLDGEVGDAGVRIHSPRRR